MLDNSLVKKVFVPAYAMQAAGISTTPKLGNRILNGERGYMNRAAWPLEVMIDGENIIEPAEMRKDYENIVDIVASLIEHSDNDSFLIWRTNIPMNLGAAWYESGSWYGHADDPTAIDEVPIIDLFPEGEITTRVVKTDGSIPENHCAVLTPCFGKCTFDEELFIAGTYDVRHLLDFQYRWPHNGETFEGLKHATVNKQLTQLAHLFTYDTEAYVEKIKKMISTGHKWSTYTRTVLAVGAEGVEFYSLKGLNPVDIFKAIQSRTELSDFTVFGLVEGGSFSVGIVSDRNVYELGLREPKNYHRPPQGMWLGWMKVEKEYGKFLLATKNASSLL